MAKSKAWLAFGPKCVMYACQGCVQRVLSFRCFASYKPLDLFNTKREEHDPLDCFRRYKIEITPIHHCCVDMAATVLGVRFYLMSTYIEKSPIFYWVHIKHKHNYGCLHWRPLQSNSKYMIVKITIKMETATQYTDIFGSINELEIEITFSYSHTVICQQLFPLK